MDPQQMMAMMAEMMRAGRAQEHPLQRLYNTPGMFSGVPINAPPMFDLSSIGLPPSSAAGGAMSMAFQTFLPSIMGPNFIPGQFSPTMNFGTYRQNMFQMQERRAAMAQAGQADANSYFSTLRGFAAAQGTVWNPEQEAAGRRQAQDLVPIMNMLGGLAPELAGALHGRVGSQYIGTGNLFDAGRYQFDPSSGRLGMSAESTSAISNQVFNRLYGPGANVNAMRGLRFEQATDMYREIAGRGFAQGGDRTREEQAQLDSLAGNQPAIDAAMRSFNATRVTRTMETYRGAVSAMREIFGDMGRPNAPMLEIINGLQALTQGGMAHMTGAQLEQSVRATHTIANATGLGMERMIGLSGQIAQMTDQTGAHRALVPEITRQAALFGFAYGQPGANPTQFGTMDREQATLTAGRLHAQAATSPLVTRVGAFMRIANQHQRMSEGGMTTGFAPGTEAHALSEAVRNFQTSYSFGGTTRSVFQDDPSMQRILTSAGVNRAVAGSLSYTAPGAVQSEVEQFQLANSGFRVQAEIEGRRNFGSAYTNAFGTTMGTGTLSRAQRRERLNLASVLGPAMFDAVRGLRASNVRIFDRGREAERNTAIADMLMRTHGPRLESMGYSRADVVNMVSASWTSGDNYAASSGLGMTQGAYYDIHNTRTREVSAAAAGDMEGIRAFAQSLSASGVGTGDFITRTIDYIQSQGDRGVGGMGPVRPGGGSFRDFISTALGGVRTQDAVAPIESLMRRVAALQTEYVDAGRGSDADHTRRVRDRIERERANLLRDIERLRNTSDVSSATRALSPEGTVAVNTAPTSFSTSSPGNPAVNALNEPSLLFPGDSPGPVSSVSPGTGAPGTAGAGAAGASSVTISSATITLPDTVTLAGGAAAQRLSGTLTLIGFNTAELVADGEAVDPRAGVA